MKKVIFALVVVVLLATAPNANAGYSYTNNDTRFGKINKSHKLLGIHRHAYRIVKR